jgi:hypothetical protein
MIEPERCTIWPYGAGSDPRKAAERLEEYISDAGLDNINLEAWLAGYAVAVMNDRSRDITKSGANT